MTGVANKDIGTHPKLWRITSIGSNAERRSVKG